MSSLAKGSSGTSVKRGESTTPKSLQKWLSTGNKQGSGNAARPLTLPKPQIQPVANEVEMPLANPFPNDTTMQWTSEDTQHNVTAEKIIIPETPSPKPASSQAHGGFSFGDMCMSPEDNFRFAPHVLPETPFDTRIGKITNDASSVVPTSLPGMLSSETTSHDQDFKFAVPSAPPPGRSMRRGHGKNEEKHPQASTSNKDLFSSPFSSAGIENDSFDAGSTNMSFSFMASDEEPSGSAFSLFGGNMQNVVDQSPTSHGFPMFKDDEEKPSPFGSLFSLK